MSSKRCAALAIASIRTLLRANIAPRLNSLQARLIAAAAVWTVLGLVVGGVVLSSIFRTSVESDFDARLKFDLDGLIAAADPGPAGQVTLQGRFTDPRFERVYSGWYWQIAPDDKKLKSETQISRSLFDHTIKVTDTASRGNVQWGHGVGPENAPMRIVWQHVEFPIADTPSPLDTQSYRFLVAGDSTQVDNEIARFNSTLLWSFAVLGIGLIAAIYLQVRVGLIPLRRMRTALSRIRDGKARRLDDDFPAEIAPLAAELNGLIEHNAEV